MRCVSPAILQPGYRLPCRLGTRLDSAFTAALGPASGRLGSVDRQACQLPGGIRGRQVPRRWRGKGAVENPPP